MTLILPCLACGSANRVPEEKIELGLTPRCGRCKAPLRHPDTAAE